MEIYKLSCEHRDENGKGAARRTRSTGRVPGILYGRKADPVSLTVDEAAMRTILNQHPDSAIVDLSIGEREDSNAVIRDVQRHPATGQLLHIDFQRISLDEKVSVDVSLRIDGNPTGVKDQGGVLEHGLRSVVINCLPRDIPEEIPVDVSLLSIGDAIKLEDVIANYPGIDFEDDPDQVVATVIPPRLEEVAEPAEGEEGEEGAEPELVKKESDEDEEDDKEKDD